MYSESTITVRKASGEEEPFDAGKLKRSLLRAGAEDIVAAKIVANIKDWIYPGVSTKKIYYRAISILRSEKTVSALRYKLKQAMLELGPTGYPFEHFVGKIFEAEGYKIKVGKVIDGYCVSHEMDVIATNRTDQILVECKYSSSQGKQVSIQVPLYVRSRVDDIIRKRKELREYEGVDFLGCVVTNTRFSLDSVEYGKCSGIRLLGWDFPEGNGLKEIIEREKIYPVTILSNLTKKEKRILMEQGVVTCSQLTDNFQLIDQLQLTKRKYNALKIELKKISNKK
jgi:hypothetical protein